MTTPQSIGRQGEQIAGAILKRKGFRMEAANWRCGKLGEIDLIAYHPQEKLLAFVEVKTRRGQSHGIPLEAVDARKQAQLGALAEAFLAAHPHIQAEIFRFDVVGVYFPGGGRPAEVEHLENAFGG